MPINPDEVVQKRMRLKRGTHLMLTTYADLENISFQEALDRVVLYGIAYLNERNKMDYMQWLDTIRLPKIKEVEKYVES